MRQAPDRTAYPIELEKAEAALLKRRRAKSGVDFKNGTGDVPLPGDAIGFGLSGGGIRSATFCLGLFQAMAESRCLRRIDFLSTVSGGGYFGGFLGRLFSRDWVNGPDDVESVIRGIEPTSFRNDPQAHQEKQYWPDRLFRWLRENGRYLAPRGSGDLLLMGVIFLRNWVAVQVVMIITVLAVFLGLQALNAPLDYLLDTANVSGAYRDLLACGLPGSNRFLLWSPWLIVVAPLLILTVPAGWAYWLVVVRESDGKNPISPALGVAFALAFGAAGMLRYQLAAPSMIAARLPDLTLSWLSPVPDHRIRFWLCAVLTITALLTLLYRNLVELPLKDRASLTSVELGNVLRSRLTTALKVGVLACVVVCGWALVDTAAGTLYAISREGSLPRWGASIAAIFAGLGAFGRSALVLLAPKRRGNRPPVSMSIISWVAAVVVLSLWLIAIDVGAHAIAWELGPEGDAPAGLLPPPPRPTLLGLDQIHVTPSGDRFVITPGPPEPSPICKAPDAVTRSSSFVIAALTFFGIVVLFFGNTRTFANLSSLHAFYSSRLTRTFLGATNPNRLGPNNTAVKDTVADDDCSAECYWRWPRISRTTPNRIRKWRVGIARWQSQWWRKSRPAIVGQWQRRQWQSRRRKQVVSRKWPWQQGGPLHIVNTTVNETVDARTKVQNQDRKGTGLAFGPCGISLGIRHHVISNPRDSATIHPNMGYRVFRTHDEGGRTPESLSLGRWMSVSGAAFSTAAGANTTVPIAILAGMFNVRLGYWWDSGTPAAKGRLGWPLFERLLPVQAALTAESLARTRGTADTLWNLSDGGHFENMGGYELIRRRLPLIVIVDAEADPDYEFQGLSDLVRMARLDFDAEITFLNASQLANGRRASRESNPDVGQLPEPVVPKSLLQFFGDLSSLRRGRWSDESIPGVDGDAVKRYIMEVDRSRVSQAHAALARVQYKGTGDTSWLVYLKATLMGDEPEDVCHYHRSHPEFPQETTTDQFFDEAQWESYRRLGRHIGHRVLTGNLFDYLLAMEPNELNKL